MVDTSYPISGLVPSTGIAVQRPLGDWTADVLRARATPPNLNLPAVMASPPILTLTKTATPSMASPRVLTNPNAAFKYTGANISPAGWAIYYVSAAPVTYVEFWSDAPKLDLILLGQSVVSMDLLIDNVRCSGSNVITDNSGAQYIYTIDWSGVRQEHHYRLGFINLFFAGVNIGPSDSIWYPSERKAPLLCVFGDSYALGSVSNQFFASIYNVAANRLGLEPYSTGYGGAGWTSTGAPAPTTRIANEITPLTTTPGIILTAMGYNDAGAASGSITAGYNGAITALRAAWPSAKLITLGPAYPQGVTAPLTAVETALSAAAATAGISFISQAGWITTANDGIYTGGDNVHPSASGSLFLGARLAEAMLAVI